MRPRRRLVQPASQTASEVRAQLAAAHASGEVLRATAKVVRADQGALCFRLNRAADALDRTALLVVRCLERIEALEQEIKDGAGCDGS
jgi:hypothetical protein